MPDSDIIEAPQPIPRLEDPRGAILRSILDWSKPMPDQVIRVSTKGIPLCGHCGKPATIKCNGCINAPKVKDYRSADTVYCNKDCQKADWPKHKAWCVRLQNRKKVFRIGDILQAMFYSYRERVFDKDIVKVKEKGGKLLVYEGKYNRSTHRPHGSVLQPFPNHLLTKEHDKHALLVYLACDDALGFMHETVKYLLSGA
jgi:hypothetical protein